MRRGLMEMPTFVICLAALAVVAMASGTTLAALGYSSAGAFSVAAACVGVLGTLAAEQHRRNGEH